MPLYVSAKEFRQKFSEIVEDLEEGNEIVVLKRSKPLFRAIPFREMSPALLDRASDLRDSGQPDLREISRIVHKVRRVRGGVEDSYKL
jgi:prevent-host-death family protein